jgi:hypothetical protein
LPSLNGKEGILRFDQKELTSNFAAVAACPAIESP